MVQEYERKSFAYFQGLDEFLLGKDQADCEYESGTEEYDDWMAGWQNGWNLRYDRYNKI